MIPIALLGLATVYSGPFVSSRLERPNVLRNDSWEEHTVSNGSGSQVFPQIPSLTNPWLGPTTACSCAECAGAESHRFSWAPGHHLTSLLFRHTQTNDPERFMGKGVPLTSTSWLNRPVHAGWFMGGLIADNLVDSQAVPEHGFFGGYRLGYDFDHYWGSETRFGFAHVGLRDNPGLSRDFFWDVHLLRYPWGDSRWRPYASVGLGLANFRFTDNQSVKFNEVSLHVPIGFGLKYYHKKWLALRVDALDNIAIGTGGRNNMHNVSLTGGIEVHFGGWRRAYYPWNPSIHYW